MRMSGSIRQTKIGVRRFVVSRQSPSRFALPEGTARRVADAHQSEPGFFFPVEPATVFCTVFKSSPSQRAVTSYCIAPQGKAHGSSEEQFP
jgi:hypothetical protein